MPSKSPTTRVARRLLTRSGAATGAEQGILDSATGVEQAFRVLAEDLSRWFGVYGYHALLARALAQTRREHPVLATIQVRSEKEPWLAALPEAVGAHGVVAAIEGLVALLAELIDLLGRMIGRISP